MSNSSEDTPNIESKVPGEQELRRDVAIGAGNSKNSNDIIEIKEEFFLAPVITVTKNEAAFTKGNLKLQKVTVNEDISNAESNEGIKDMDPKAPSDTSSYSNNELSEERPGFKKVSKIPKLSFKQAASKVGGGKERDDEPEHKIVLSPKPKSGIPRFKDSKLPPLKPITDANDYVKVSDSPTEEEFDKIYEEIVEIAAHNKDNVVIDETNDAEIVDSIFEEIIHAYDEEQIEPVKTEKVRSKIPLLKRKSEPAIEPLKLTDRRNSLKNVSGKIPVMNLNKEKITEFETKSSQLNSHTSNITSSKWSTLSNKFVESSQSREVSKSVTTTVNSVAKEQSSTNNHQVTNVELKDSDIDKMFNSLVTQENELVISSLHLNEQRITAEIYQQEHMKYISEQITSRNHELENFSSIEDLQSFEDLETVIENECKDVPITSVSSVVETTSTGDNTHELEYSIAISEIKKNGQTNSKNESINIMEDKINVSTNDNYKQNKIEVDSVKVVAIDSSALRNTNLVESVYERTSIENQQQINQILDINYNNITEIRETESKFNLVNKEIQNEEILSDSNEVDKQIEVSDMKLVNAEIKNEVILSDSNKVERQIEDSNIKLVSKEVQNKVTLSDTNKNEILMGCSNINLASREIQNEVMLSHTNKENVLQNKPVIEDFLEVVHTNKENVLQNKPVIEDSLEVVSIKYTDGQIEKSRLNNDGSIEKYTEINSKNSNATKERISTDISRSIDNIIKEKLSSNNKNVDDLEEEDIIILKGKVNRIISRLDSREPKINKTEGDDIPKNISVMSKIALFEKSEPSHINTHNQGPLKKTNRCQSTKDDKPRIVHEVLKTSVRNKVFSDQGVKEIKTSEIRFSYNTSNVHKNNSIDLTTTPSNEDMRNGSIDTSYERNINNVQTNRDDYNHVTKLTGRSESKIDSKRLISIIDNHDNIKMQSSEAVTDVYNTEENTDLDHKTNDHPHDDTDRHEVFLANDGEGVKKTDAVYNAYKAKRFDKYKDVDIKRAKSVAELDLGDVVTGKVKQMVFRMKSIDKLEFERKEVIDVREKPRRGSVSERIALFEVSL